MKLLPLFLIASLASCASFLSGSMQNVTISTPGAEGASCSLTDSKGRTWNISSTPGNVMVKKGDGPLSVICKKEGYQMSTGKVGERMADAVYGNMLIPVGFLIDSITGSGQQYTSSIEIEMEPVESSEGNDW